MSSSKTADSSDSNSYIINKTWELNIYELNRMPHDIIRDSTEIAVSPKILQNELMCPICLDILKNTMTTKECLHRFCHDCIITALRAGNKECPTCRKKLVSKRSLRPDPNFDGIISRIYPNREEYDALHEKVLEKLNKKHLTAINSANNNNNGGGGGGGGGGNTPANGKASRQTSRTSKASAASDQATAENAAASTDNNAVESSSSKKAKPAVAVAANGAGRGTKRTVAAINHSYDSDMESRASTEHSSSLHLPTDPDEIELVLKPHPFKETALSSSRFLKTTCNATMNHLSKYLWTRLCVEENKTLNQESNASNDFTIFILESNNTNSHSTKQPASDSNAANTLSTSYQPLTATTTLENVLERYWKSNKPVELFYLFKATCKSNGQESETEATTTTAVAPPTDQPSTSHSTS